MELLLLLPDLAYKTSLTKYLPFPTSQRGNGIFHTGNGNIPPISRLWLNKLLLQNVFHFY